MRVYDTVQRQYRAAFLSSRPSRNPLLLPASVPIHIFVFLFGLYDLVGLVASLDLGVARVVLPLVGYIIVSMIRAPANVSRGRIQAIMAFWAELAP